MVKKIYFAASIRGGRSDQKIYAEIIEELKKFGLVLSEHFGNPNLTDSGEELASTDIRNRDKDWVREADIIIAEVTTPSLGVGMELGWAEEWGKKVICFYREQDERRLSALVDGSPNFDLFRYKDISELKEVLIRELK